MDSKRTSAELVRHSRSGSFVAVSVSVAMSSSMAFGGMMKPSGTYSEARLEEVRPKMVAQPFAEASNAGQMLTSPTDSPVAMVFQDLPGLERDASGVASYDVGASPRIPRLDIGREERIQRNRYALESRFQSIIDQRVITPLETPELLSSQEVARLKSMVTEIATGQPPQALKIKDVVFAPKGKVSREAFDKIVMDLKPELELKLRKFVPLTSDETRFLSGLLLYQKGDRCASAVGLFHQLSKAKGWQPEADYYLAMCSKKLGLETDFLERARRILEGQDVHYAPKILKEVAVQLPYEFIERFGQAAAKTATNRKITEKLDAKTNANLAYWIAEAAVSTGKYKGAIQWAKQVPLSHQMYLQARFLEALSEYQAGSKSRALAIQEELISDIKTDRAQSEFQALVALNVARMYFQESKFKPAHEAFLKVYKDHPLWLQSLTEMGWSQLQSGDFEGAIGNMYSIQSPFFSAVYKPESYVIRSIGYLNLCQYGDAYRTLSMLEHEYRPFLERMNRYVSTKPAYYQTVRNFLLAPNGAKEVDGLPLQVVREMARHRDFTNLQKALNRQLDERQMYSKIEGEVEKSLKHSQWLVNNSRRRTEDLRKRLGMIFKNPQAEQNRNQWTGELQSELEALNGYFFEVDLFNEARLATSEYRKDVVGGADQRLSSMRSSMESILSARMGRMRKELSLALENNELLRYEVFAGSGENIRYQVAGGERGTRIPASVIPKSKSLQWDFDGEYWEDEIGHYRSSLKNNCPESARAGVQANLDGGAE